MRIFLKDGEGIPRKLLLLLAVLAGLSVANLYYNQPLLDMMSTDLGCSDTEAGYITLFTQVGYALGLLFLIPLGDLVSRRKIAVVNFGVLVVSLLVIALSHNLKVILAASLLTGVSSVMPQFFIPLAAQFSRLEDKDRNVGIVLSGLLTGILASRVLSGAVGELAGWRQMYLVASAIMLVCAFTVYMVMPSMDANFRGTYPGLMRSIAGIVRRFPVTLVISFRSALAFGAFMCFWASLSFMLARPPFNAGSDVAGLMGLCGIAGAVTASFLGKYVRRVGIRRFNLIGISAHLAGWAILFAVSADCLGIGSPDYMPLWCRYAGMALAVVVIDIGMQCIQLSNQSAMFSIDPKASNRINTIFMTIYFLGGAAGTFLSGIGWSLAGWTGVLAAGALMSLASMSVVLLSRE